MSTFSEKYEAKHTPEYVAKVEREAQILLGVIFVLVVVGLFFAFG